jgi:predicted HicB family RNase H-like nuclease
MKKNPIGRPKASDPLLPMPIRVPASLKKRCEKAAKKAKVSLREWVRSTLDAAAP